MPIDRRRRVTFEETADLYNELMSPYPEALIQDVISLSGIPEGGRILEVGAGPGNATMSFAACGYRIVGIELGERLSLLAEYNCRGFPAVEIINTSFEDWTLQPNLFDLVISADAFHWIPPEIGYPKAAAALRETGSAAFFWRVPVDPETAWSREIDAVYAAVVPGQDSPDKSFNAEWLTGVITENFASCGCFGEMTVGMYPWSLTRTADQYIKALRTYSGHRDLDEDTRSRLYAGIRTVLDRYGGSVDKPQLTALFHARVKR